MDLGPHAAFIIAAYLATALVVGGLLVWLLVERAHLRRQLDRLERRRPDDGQREDHT
ncbi:MAG: heme exporter protein CcmD [Rhizobiales bacterium]|nr:heme exporter protein CcmD [Hyphomicrobiales bacterium]